MRIIYFILLIIMSIFLYSISTFAEEPFIVWEKHIGIDTIAYDLGNEYNNMIKLEDKYLIITTGQCGANAYYIFQEINQSGEVLKTKVDFYDVPATIQIFYSPGKSYIYGKDLYLIGITHYGFGDATRFLKIDMNNYEITNNILDSTFSGIDFHSYLFQKDSVYTIGNNFIRDTIGNRYWYNFISTYDSEFNNVNNVVIDTSGFGFPISKKGYYGTGTNFSNALQSEDGNCIVFTRYKDSLQNKVYDLPIKFDKQGKVVWSSKVNLFPDDVKTHTITGAISLNNGKYIAKTVSFGIRYNIIYQFDDTGKLLFYKVFNDTTLNDKFRLFHLSELKYIDELDLIAISGYQIESNEKRSLVLLLLNSMGDIVKEYVWEPVLGTPRINSVYYLKNGNLLIQGKNRGISEPYIAEIAFDGTGVSDSIAISDLISISPQPANDFLKINGICSPNEKIYVYNLSGKLIKEIQTSSDIIYIGDISNGIYFLEHNNQRFKFIKN